MLRIRRVATRAGVAGILLLAGISGIGVAEAAGALAVGHCGAYGYAYDFRAADRARAAALKKCSGPGCKVVVAMKRNCAAMAIDLKDACGAYGFASASRLGPAQNTALQQCYENGGKDCVIRAFVCDGKG
jgi:hypothetical protein